ncbi:MAG TPA: type II secretion system secretin GspD [Candidatus Sulfobium mesophilum]|nr:type II secretion system secretin GspD [Candidatus Sulfobium mesophilum]
MKRLNRFVFSSRIFFICVILIFSLSTGGQTVLAGSSSETKKSNNVTFNFVDVELPVIAKFISEITGKNFIFDEKVKGKITIIAPSKLSIDDAYSLFTSVLELKGYTIAPSGVDVYKIIPAVEAKQQGLKVSTEGIPINESYIARLLTFRHVSADDALRFLQPLVSKDGHISIFGPGNLLLVIDSGLNVEKILSLAELIDRPSATEMPEVIPLKYSSADAVAKILNEGMGKVKARPVAGQQSAIEMASAVADQRLNAIILFGDRGGRESMKALISLLDTPAPGAQGKINVYFLENADATELAKVLEGMLRGVQAPKQPAGTPGVPVAPLEAAGGITITADKASNSLVIVASPADYQNLSQIIRQLDKRRRQVYVEAMIIETSIDKLRSLGVQWRATATQGGSPIAIGGFGTIDQTTFVSILQGLQGATLGGMGNFLTVPVTSIDSSGKPVQQNLQIPGFAALFALNDFRDTINVLSTPQILTSDNKEAEILVGENVPFISQSQTTSALGTTTSGTTSGIVNSIVRQDVGIILKITPQITEGDSVKLDLYQEISSVKNQSDALTVSVGPTITKRSTKTSVVVKDNQTVVIGGLMQEQDEDQTTKMPFLGDIPLLGWLFKTKSVTKNKTNLIVFLNPHIIKEADRLAELSRVKDREFAVASRRYVSGELMVKFKEGVPDEKVRSIISEKGATVIKFIDNLRVYQLRLKAKQSVEEAVDEFSKIAEVEYAEPNYIITIN